MIRSIEFEINFFSNFEAVMTGCVINSEQRIEFKISMTREALPALWSKALPALGTPSRKFFCT
jgi:hypothetical protein